MSLRQTLATSPHPAAAFVRKAHRAYHGFSLPTPRVVVVPALWAFLAVRSAYYFAVRVLVCEPLFKAYCTSYGRNVRTTAHVHWVQGKGRIILGDNVEVRGKCSFTFAARFSNSPTLEVGGNTNIGHSSSFVVGKRITIGRNCMIASEVVMFDSNGHPSDPSARLAGLPLSADEVRPITIGDNVWIGLRTVITPGVTVGDNSIVSAGSVVISDVPPNVVVAGYPARKIATLTPPGPGADAAPAAH